MPPEPLPSALRRMAGAAAAPRAASPAGEAPALERALATAALRVGDGLAGLGLATQAKTIRLVDRADAFADIDERALCLLLDPHGHDRMAPAPDLEAVARGSGLLVFDPGLTDALVEVQTIGRVDGPARPPRRPTRVDAALAQPFARALLEQLARQRAPGCDEPRPGALRSGSFVAGPSSLALVLTAPGFLRLDLTLALGAGARTGVLMLILPATAATAPAPVAGPARPAAAWADAMRDVAMDAPVRLEAVLPPMRLPLSRLMALAVGDLVLLDPAALGEITLHGGASGVTRAGRKRLPKHATFRARLGQLNGERAVRICALPGQAHPPSAPAGLDEGFAPGRSGRSDAAEGEGPEGERGSGPPQARRRASDPPDAGEITIPADGPARATLPDPPGLEAIADRS